MWEEGARIYNNPKIANNFSQFSYEALRHLIIQLIVQLKDKGLTKLYLLSNTHWPIDPLLLLALYINKPIKCTKYNTYTKFCTSTTHYNL